MKILVINCGSSSVKYKLFDMASGGEILASGGVEKIGLPDSCLVLKMKDGSKKTLMRDMPTHTESIAFIFETLTSKEEWGAIASMDEVNAVGHRVVHGGEKFNKSVLITDEVIKEIEHCSDMAPLHNPANIEGILTIAKLLPNVPQVAVFDTAFHQTMPKKAFMYAIPYALYEKYGIRRYGFHGTSHRYVSARACEYLGLPVKGTRMITCHIGNGGSITAIKDGESIDTTMGFTPLEGLMMGTRSGDIDAGAVTYIMNKEGLDASGVSALLNKKSGVDGISGVSSDMRDAQAAAEAGNERAALALDMYIYRIIKYIGAYTAALGGVDVIVLTAGVGENQAPIRKSICEKLGFLGVKFDEEANKCRGIERVITTPDSPVTVVIIPTDEELMIAEDCAALV
ncbi:MAG: acetate kinase [Paludibacteraceae bacterium]|nr:acetate kinase [Paludibacteraceae bacterium]